MCMHMCVCICVYVHVCICMCVCVCVCIYVCIYIFIYISMCRHTDIHTYKYVYSVAILPQVSSTNLHACFPHSIKMEDSDKLWHLPQKASGMLWRLKCKRWMTLSSSTSLTTSHVKLRRSSVCLGCFSRMPPLRHPPLRHP